MQEIVLGKSTSIKMPKFIENDALKLMVFSDCVALEDCFLIISHE